MPVLIVDANKPPVFTERGGGTERYLYENPPTPFGRFGAVRRMVPVAATDPDGDTLRYALEGRDAHLFTIDEAAGWIMTRADTIYDYETEKRTCHYNGDPEFRPCYVMRVRVTDSFGASATKGLSILLDNRVDRVVQNFRVAAAPGSDRELQVSWNAVSADERPESYSLEWYPADEGESWRWYRKSIEGDRSGTRLRSLEADTRYRVRVRPVYPDDHDLDYWSRTVVGGTGAASGPVPVSAAVGSDGTAVLLRFDEGIGATVGASSAFRIIAGGAEAGIASIARHASEHTVLSIAVDPPIAAGRTVTVQYRDPDPGSDAPDALQDTAGNDAASFSDFAVTNNSGVQGAPPEALTAAFGDLPARHTGEAFTIELAFSEELPVTEEALRAGLTVAGGTLTAVAQAVEGESRNWDLTVTPTARADAVTVTLGPKESCAAANAICTADGRGLSAPVEAEVPGREPTRVVRATVTSDPGENGTWDTGETVTAAVVFNRAVAVQGPPNVKPTLGVVLGGARREAELATTGSADTFVFSHTVTAADDGADTATVAADGITLNGTVIADNEGNEAILTFATGPALSVADATATAGDDATADFVVTLAPAATGTVTVDYATADGTATAPADYASTSGTLTFAPGETSKTVSVSIVDDTVEDDGETFTLTLDNASGATLADATATGTVRNAEETDALTAEFRNLPEDGHGGAEFTLELKFSEELPLSYVTLRDHALGVSGGTVSEVSRAAAGENKAWNVTVTPAAGAGDVTVTLAATSDCAAPGALCTTDGRALSAPVSATVPATAGPETTEAPAPFRVRLEAPGEHDGASEVAFRVLFNKDPVDYSYVTLRDSTVRIVRAGTRLAPTGVKRLNAPASDRWSVRVAPGGKGDLTVSVGPFASCSDTGAVCAAGGEVLANAVTKTILGPPGLIGRRRAGRRGPGRDGGLPGDASPGRRPSTVTVDYATSDGTGANAATAGADYTADLGHADLRAGRDGEDGLGAGARRQPRRGRGDVHADALEPAGRQRLARRRDGDGNDREHGRDAQGVARALRAHGGGAGARCGRGAAAHGAARRGRGDAGRRGAAALERGRDGCRGHERLRDERLRDGGRGGPGEGGPGGRGAGGRGQGAADVILGLAAGRPGGRAGRRGRGRLPLARGDGTRPADRDIVCAERGGGRRRAGLAVGPGRGLALRRTGGRPFARRRGGERDAGCGLGARGLDRRAAGVAFARRGRLPGRGRGHGDVERDRALPLRALHGEPAGGALGRGGLRRRHADADAEEPGDGRDGQPDPDRHGPDDGGGGPARGGGRGAGRGRLRACGDFGRDGRAHLLGEGGGARGGGGRGDPAPARSRGQLARPRARRRRTDAAFRGGPAP